MNNYEEMENVNDIAEEVVDKKSPIKRVFTRERVIKGVKIVVIGILAFGASVLFGKLATPKELETGEVPDGDEENNSES